MLDGHRRASLLLVRSELIALVIAGLVAWLILAVRDVGVPWVTRGSLEASAQWLSVYAGFGILIALALCLLLGLMAFQFLEARNLRCWWHATLLGAAIGAAFTFAGLITGIYPRLLSTLWWLAPFDIVAGAAAGTVAWICAKSRIAWAKP